MAAATVLACPFRTAMALSATQGLRVGVAFGVEAPRRAPQVLEDVDEVDEDRKCDPAGLRFGVETVDLVVVPVHQRHPAARMGRVTPFGFGEECGQDVPGVVDHASDHPISSGVRAGSAFRCLAAREDAAST